MTKPTTKVGVVFVSLLMCTYAADMCRTKCTCRENILNCTGLTQKEFNSEEFRNSITNKHEKIHVINGMIKELPKNVLRDCSGDTSLRLDKLKKFDLQNNLIEVIHGQSLHCMPNLKELNLANNQWNISTVHSHVFTSIGDLQTLNLSNALHDGIPGKIHLDHLNLIFMDNNLPELETLVLSNNRFEVFDEASANAVCSLGGLKHLILAHNLLPKVTLYHKTCLQNLEKLDLSYNNIMTFPDTHTHQNLLYGLDYIQSRQSLKNITVSVNFLGNEFDCDCGLLEFHNWLRRTKVHVIKKTNLTCHDGLHAEKSIFSLQTDQFVCVSVNPSSSSNRAVVGVLVTLFVLVALVLIIVIYIKRAAIERFVRSWQKPSLAKEHLFGYSSVNNENATDIEV